MCSSCYRRDAFLPIYVSRLEQGVRKKAQELEKKARETQKERDDLRREMERLNSVKQIGGMFTQSFDSTSSARFLGKKQTGWPERTGAS